VLATNAQNNIISIDELSKTKYETHPMILPGMQDNIIVEALLEELETCSVNPVIKLIEKNITA